VSDEPNDKKQPLARYEGPSRAAPYPLSRMAPAFDLVDTAREIQRADETLATMTGGKLSLIAEQIRHLQVQAKELLEKARRDLELHRARCHFEKKPGDVYHLYREDDSGVLFFSLLGPREWSLPQRHTFVGSYRLEMDQSFSPVEGEA